MKILILGLSGSGKSTVAKLIAEKINLKVIESDDFVKKYNGGVWPESDEVISTIYSDLNKKVIKKDNLIYVTSWMNHETIKKFHKEGFIIIELHAELEELVRRKIKRDSETPERIEKFKLTYIEYFNTVLNENIKDLYSISIDTTNKTTADIENIIAQHIFP